MTIGSESDRPEVFEVDVVTEADDVDACVAILERVRRDEMNRGGESVLESDVFKGLKADYELLGCRSSRTGELVGCIRLTPAEQLIGSPSTVEEYRLDTFGSEALATALILTRLAVVPEHRHTLAGLALYEAIYRHSIEGGFELNLLSCEPNLMPLYRSIGARPYGRLHRASHGSLRVPMVFVLHDVDHFHAVESPVAHVGDGLAAPGAGFGINWYAGLVEREGTIEAGVRPYSDLDGEAHSLLSRGLSEAGRSELLANCLLLAPRRGARVIAENDGSRAAGFVINGMLEVRRGERVVGLLGPGEIFGEMAAILEDRRTATITAATDDTEVAVLSQRAFDRVSEPTDREQLWRNLAGVLAARLAGITARVATGATSSTEPPRSSRLE